MNVHRAHGWDTLHVLHVPAIDGGSGLYLVMLYRGL